MAGRNRRNRVSIKNDFHHTQAQDQSPNNRSRPLRTFGPTSYNRPRRRSNAQTHGQGAGIHRSRSYDNSNPDLGAKFRGLKQKSDTVKRELEELMKTIDEMQPEDAAMDWSCSAGTIVYVPIQRETDGSLHHPQMLATNPGYWPNDQSSLTSYPDQISAATSDSTTQPPTMQTNNPMVPPREGTGVRNDEANARQTTPTAADYGPTDQSSRRTQGSGMADHRNMARNLAIPEQRMTEERNRENVRPPDLVSKGGISNPGSSPTNQLRAAAASLLTPPPSPLAQNGQARRGSAM